MSKHTNNLFQLNDMKKGVFNNTHKREIMFELKILNIITRNENHKIAFLLPNTTRNFFSILLDICLILYINSFD